MISRSFGLNIGAAIGIALYLSQAISVSFYIIALNAVITPRLSRNHLSCYWTIRDSYLAIIANMFLLALLMLFKGADIGLGALYCSGYFIYIIDFIFLGDNNIKPISPSFNDHVANPDSFFTVFTIIFPFTGILQV